MKDTEYHINETSKHLGFYTKKVANISEEYFYRGLKSTMAVGDMTFKNILKNIKIQRKKTLDFMFKKLLGDKFLIFIFYQPKSR